MPYTEAAKNQMLDALVPNFASMHTGDPGAAGANEVAGGAPAYARKAIGFAAAAGSARDSNLVPVFDIPPATTVSHYGLWAGATFLGGFPLSSSETFTGQGTYSLTAVAMQAT